MKEDSEIMNEKDEEIAQLKRQLIEFKEAHMQSAASITLDPSSRSLSLPTKGFLKHLLKVARFKMILIVLIIFVIAIGGVWLFAGSISKKESITFIEHVQELATLATAQAHMKVILHEEDNKIFGKDISINLPGTKRELLLIVPATVIAGVDLKGTTAENMDINEETKEINIIVPHAKLIQDPSVQMDKILTYVNGGLFRGDIEWEEGFDLAAKAQEQFRQEAISVGLLVTAEKNADKVLKEFFKKFGYTVNVTFK
ncbi:DUF4230 domain-containing protein [Paenibacillus soyae]|uniref:DUF4230 domain-containing protein n=1 Tax=Paenibacillus soyae TaxID=2969249 RepID=A0A9X2MPC1_9BACL|nr:DUF4230 domain-containing protein [Paenibacillus soyae]MCR2803995.1 DUF4230 domain-containing protein [Paenibacillus soyae]